MSKRKLLIPGLDQPSNTGSQPIVQNNGTGSRCGKSSLLFPAGSVPNNVEAETAPQKPSVGGFILKGGKKDQGSDSKGPRGQKSLFPMTGIVPTNAGAAQDVQSTGKVLPSAVDGKGNPGAIDARVQSSTMMSQVSANNTMNTGMNQSGVAMNPAGTKQSGNIMSMAGVNQSGFSVSSSSTVPVQKDVAPSNNGFSFRVPQTADNAVPNGSGSIRPLPSASVSQPPSSFSQPQGNPTANGCLSAVSQQSAIPSGAMGAGSIAPQVGATQANGDTSSSQNDGNCTMNFNPNGGLPIVFNSKKAHPFYAAQAKAKEKAKAKAKVKAKGKRAKADGDRRDKTQEIAVSVPAKPSRSLFGPQAPNPAANQAQTAFSQQQQHPGPTQHAPGTQQAGQLGQQQFPGQRQQGPGQFGQPQYPGPTQQQGGQFVQQQQQQYPGPSQQVPAQFSQQQQQYPGPSQQAPAQFSQQQQQYHGPTQQAPGQFSQQQQQNPGPTHQAPDQFGQQQQQYPRPTQQAPGQFSQQQQQYPGPTQQVPGQFSQQQQQYPGPTQQAPAQFSQQQQQYPGPTQQAPDQFGQQQQQYPGPTQQATGQFGQQQQQYPGPTQQAPGQFSQGQPTQQVPGQFGQPQQQLGGGQHQSQMQFSQHTQLQHGSTVQEQYTGRTDLQVERKMQQGFGSLSSPSVLSRPTGFPDQSASAKSNGQQQFGAISNQPDPTQPQNRNVPPDDTLGSISQGAQGAKLSVVHQQSQPHDPHAARTSGSEEEWLRNTVQQAKNGTLPARSGKGGFQTLRECISGTIFDDLPTAPSSIENVEETAESTGNRVKGMDSSIILTTDKPGDGREASSLQCAASGPFASAPSSSAAGGNTTTLELRSAGGGENETNSVQQVASLSETTGHNEALSVAQGLVPCKMETDNLVQLDRKDLHEASDSRVADGDADDGLQGNAAVTAMPTVQNGGPNDCGHLNVGSPHVNKLHRIKSAPMEVAADTAPEVESGKTHQNEEAEGYGAIKSCPSQDVVERGDKHSVEERRQVVGDVKVDLAEGMEMKGKGLAKGEFMEKGMKIEGKGCVKGDFMEKGLDMKGKGFAKGEFMQGMDMNGKGLAKGEFRVKGMEMEGKGMEMKGKGCVKGEFMEKGLEMKGKGMEMKGKGCVKGDFVEGMEMKGKGCVKGEFMEKGMEMKGKGFSKGDCMEGMEMKGKGCVKGEFMDKGMDMKGKGLAKGNFMEGMEMKGKGCVKGEFMEKGMDMKGKGLAKGDFMEGMEMKGQGCVKGEFMDKGMDVKGKGCVKGDFMEGMEMKGKGLVKGEFMEKGMEMKGKGFAKGDFMEGMEMEGKGFAKGDFMDKGMDVKGKGFAKGDFMEGMEMSGKGFSPGNFCGTGPNEWVGLKGKCLATGMFTGKGYADLSGSHDGIQRDGTPAWGAAVGGKRSAGPPVAKSDFGEKGMAKGGYNWSQPNERGWAKGDSSAKMQSDFCFIDKWSRGKGFENWKVANGECSTDYSSNQYGRTSGKGHDLSYGKPSLAALQQIAESSGSVECGTFSNRGGHFDHSRTPDGKGPIRHNSAGVAHCGGVDISNATPTTRVYPDDRAAQFTCRVSGSVPPPSNYLDTRVSVDAMQGWSNSPDAKRRKHDTLDARSNCQAPDTALPGGENRIRWTQPMDSIAPEKFNMTQTVGRQRALHRFEVEDPRWRWNEDAKAFEFILPIPCRSV